MHARLSDSDSDPYGAGASTIGSQRRFLVVLDLLVPYRYYYLSPFQNILPCTGFSDAGRCSLVTVSFSLLNSTTAAALCLMVHLAFGDRDAVSVTSSALVLEDSARGKRVFGGLRAHHHHLGYSVLLRLGIRFKMLYSEGWIFSEENHVPIIYLQWLN